MSNVVGSLVVNLLAHTAAFTKDMSSAADKAKTVMKGFGGEVSRLIGGPLGELTHFFANPSVMGVAGITSAVIAVKELSHWAHETETSAYRLGVGVEQFQRMSIAAEKTGVSVETVGHAFQRMGKHISEAWGGKKESQDVFKRLGLDPESFRGKTNFAAFEEIRKQIAGIQEGFSRARIEIDLFGKAGADLDAIVRKGGISELSKGYNIANKRTIEDAAVFDETTKRGWMNFRAGVVQNIAQVQQLGQGLVALGQLMTFQTSLKALKAEEQKRAFAEYMKEGTSPITREDLERLANAADLTKNLTKAVNEYAYAVSRIGKISTGADAVERQILAAMKDRGNISRIEELGAALGKVRGLKQSELKSRAREAIRESTDYLGMDAIESWAAKMKRMFAGVPTVWQDIDTAAGKMRLEETRAWQKEEMASIQESQRQRVAGQEALKRQFDPLESFRGAMQEIQSMELPPAITEAYMDQARKQAMGIALAGMPTPQPIGGPERETAAAFRAIAEMQSARNDPRTEKVAEISRQIDELINLTRQRLKLPDIAPDPV